jgi:hypothetical protein
MEKEITDFVTSIFWALPKITFEQKTCEISQVFDLFRGHYWNSNPSPSTIKSGLIEQIRPFLSLTKAFWAVIPVFWAVSLKLKKRASDSMLQPSEIKDKKFPFVPARLVDYSGDTSRYWFIIYYIFNVDKGKLQRKKFSEGINDTDSKRKRYRAAEEAIRFINDLLESGATGLDGTIEEYQKRIKEEADKGNKKLEITKLTLLDAIEYVKKIKEKTQVKAQVRAMNSLKAHLTIFLKERNQEHILLIGFESGLAFEFSDYLLTEAKFKEKDGTIKKGLAKKTHNNRKNDLKHVFTFFIERYPKVFVENPVKVKNKRTKTNKHTKYSPEQLEKIKEACVKLGEKQLLTFISFVYYGFFRPWTELRLLKVEHIKEKTIYIPPDLAKNDHGDYIKIAPGLEDVIEENRLRHFPHGYYLFSLDGSPGEAPVNDKYFYVRLKKILAHLKLTYDNYDMYGFAHSGCAALYKATKDIKLVQRQKRHEDIKITDVYLSDLGCYAEDEDLSSFPTF